MKSPGRRKFVTVCINDTPVTLQLDTGSDLTLISKRTWGVVKRPPVENTKCTVRNTSGGGLKLIGKLNCFVTFKVIQLNVRFGKSCQPPATFYSLFKPFGVQPQVHANRSTAIRKVKKGGQQKGCHKSHRYHILTRGNERYFPQWTQPFATPIRESPMVVAGVPPNKARKFVTANALARATGQISVEQLVAQEMAEDPVATFPSQEERNGSPVKDPQTEVDQLNIPKYSV
ncbi:hypothetical protein CLF_106766 [Clonorchis sinensis]|uniref:Peptidase A2 domain-containing protein n=1 Tax=Clonorchis sinensis TaxID=79923 RepID=G7YQ66_CLOSI|nr:hypothetical protein CLF_106766 [Clonorchis sinensis]